MKKKNVSYYVKYRYIVINRLTNVWVEGYYEHITRSVCSRMMWKRVVDHIYTLYHPGNWKLTYLILVDERRM